MYRHIQRIRDNMQSVQDPLRAAILAEDTRAMTDHATHAQAAANDVLRQVEEATRSQDSGQDDFGEPRVERNLVDAAAASLSRAVVDAQRVAMGTNVSEMREGLLGFKTLVDYAQAYLEAAVGSHSA